jgi:predicted MFS family arabinose efflux permease
MLPVVLVRGLGLSGTVLGLFLASGGVGLMAGSLAARPVVRWLGRGRALWISSLALAPAGFAVPLVDRGVWLWIAGAGWLLSSAKIGMDNVVKVTFRQRVTPDAMLGRMNATFRFLLMGALTVAGLLAGVLGASAGARAVLWLGAAVPAVSWLLLFCSPLRRLRELPEPAAPGDPAG